MGDDGSSAREEEKGEGVEVERRSRLLKGGSPEKQLSRPNGVDLSNDGAGSAP